MAGDADVADDSEPGAASAVPHAPQNFASGAVADPQVGHARASAVPHSAQNLLPASFVLPQFEQTIRPLGWRSDRKRNGRVMPR